VAARVKAALTWTLAGQTCSDLQVCVQRFSAEIRGVWPVHERLESEGDRPECHEAERFPLPRIEPEFQTNKS
jgi:hypothetical protein